VFADPDIGAPLAKAAILRCYRRALKVARLDESHRFHDLRHTFGTRMAGGTPMRTLQEWVGYRDIETTQRYADHAPSPHEAAYLEAAFVDLDLDLSRAGHGHVIAKVGIPGSIRDARGLFLSCRTVDALKG
jgi:hypothetical protein